MSLFSKFRRRRKSQPTRDHGAYDESKTCVATNSESLEVDVNYLTLEPRRVLSADFTLLGASLDLDNFSEINDENVEVDEVSTFYRFQLSEGTWSGTSSSSVIGAGTSTLLVSKSAVGDISLNDDLGIGLDVTFDNVDLSPLNNMTIVTGGDIDQLAATSVWSTQLSLTANDIDLNNAGNDFGSISTTSVNDILISDANQVVVLGADADLVAGKIEVHADGIVVASSMSADSIWLDSSQGIDQAISAGIDANELILTGQGNFELDSVTNDLNDIAADVDGRLEIVSDTGLNVAELTCGTQVTCGLNVTGDLDLQIDNGDLTQSANAAVIVGGDAFFTTTSGDICLTGGDCSGSGGNDNLVIGSISFSASGDVVYAEDGDLIIDGLTVFGNSNLSGNNIQFNTNFTAAGLVLQATDGVSLNGNSIDVTNLIVTGSGDFNFSATTNSIRNLAADVTGTLRVGSNVDLQIGSIVLASCGGNVQVCGVNVDGDLVVNLDDVRLSQSASAIVSGTATFDAGSGDICLGSGDCDGDGQNDNDFNRVTVTSANEFEIADINGLAIDGLQANQAAIVTGTAGVGAILLDGNVSISNQLLLQATDGVDQVSGVVIANELLLDGQGNFVVNNVANAIVGLAADVTGELTIGSSVDLVVGSLVYASNCSTLSAAICGVTAADLNITLDNASLSQSAAVIVSGQTIIDVGTGDVCLNGGDCDGAGQNDNDFANVDVTGSEVEIADVNGLTIDGLVADRAALNVGTSGLGQILLDGNVSVLNQLLLVATDGVDQNSGTISTNEILLQGDGDFVIDNLANSISTIAAEVSGSLDVVSARELTIDSLIYVSGCGPLSIAICGVNVGGDLDISVDNNDLIQATNASVIVGGNALFTTGTGDVCLSGGDCDGDGQNDNQIVGSIVIASSGNVFVAESDDINIASVSGGGSYRFAGNNIQVNTNIVGTELLLQATDGVSLNGNVIDVTDLILTGGGNFDLLNTSNSVQNFAADVIGSVSLGANTDVELATLVSVSDCAADVRICGVNVSEDLTLVLDDATLTQSASVAVGGLTTLSTGLGDICLSGGDCDGDGHNDNDLNEVQIDSAENVEIADVNSVTLKGTQVSDRLAVIAGQSSPGKIAFDGNVVVGNQVFLAANDGVEQVSGFVSTTSLLLDGQGTFELGDLNNEVDVIAANVTGSIELGAKTDISIGTVFYTSSCSALVAQACGVTASDDVSITLDNASLSQTAALVVGGVTTLDVGSGDICLDSGDCDGDGENDNDLNELNILSANEIEIADINDISVIGLNASNDAAIIAGDSTSTGQIVLNGDLAVSAMLLQADNGVEQLNGSIAADRLVLEVDGDVHLCLENQIGSATTAGQVSVNIDGELFVRNAHAVEMIDLDFTTKSGAIVSHNQFNVADNLSLISSGENANAVFDSTQVNVGGETQLIALGTSGDIDVENLNVVGAIGVATVDGDVRIVNAHANGVVFRGDDIPNADATEICPHFEASTVNGDLHVQALAGNISNEANATLNVTGRATLVAGTDNVSNVSGSNNEFDLKLGFEQDDDIRFLNTLSLIGRDASLSVNDSIQFSDTYIGISTATATDGGTLFMAVEGSITHEAGANVSADNVSLSASDYIVFNQIDADRVAFSAQGFVDTTSLTSVPSNLPVDADDPLAPKHTDVDVEYGIIISSQNDLLIGTVSDALGCQTNQTGIFSSQGHVYIETTNGSDIQFDGSSNTGTITANGTTFGVATEMQNGHVLTAIAGGDLTIADNTILVTTSGSVTDVSSFTTDEGVDFETVPKEGPQFQVFLPTPSDNPTTKTVNTDDTQFIGIDFGRNGDRNFVVEVTWADGTLDVLNFDNNFGSRFERISHTFTNDFLLLNFELPTTLSFYNDPAINLFDLEGANEIKSTNELNTNDNFVMAFSDSRPQGDLQIASVGRPVGVPRESVITYSEQQVSFETDSSGFGQTSTQVEEQLSDAYLVRLDDAGFELEETTQDLPESTVTQDVVAEWKHRVEDGTQYPPGKYRIKWVESGVTFSIEFEKGAEEDLEPGELRRVNEEFSPPTSNDPPEPDLDDVESELFDDVRFDDGLLVPIGKKAKSIDASTINDGLGEGLQIVVEDLADSTSRSRVGLLATGIIALGLKRKNGTRSERKTEQEELKATATEISFVKSARSRRRMQG